MHLAFGDNAWLEFGPVPLPIQTSRILLYAGYFFVGVAVGAISLRAGLLGENGGLATRWPVWLGFSIVFYVAILVLVYAHHNWVADFASPPLLWRTCYGLAFATFSASMAFAVAAFFLRFAKSHWRLLDALRPSAYGVYLVHYVFIIWLQFALYDYSLPAMIKFAIVFLGTLSASWAVIVVLRKIRVVARMI